MKFGIEIVPYYQASKLRKLASIIDNMGFDYLWVSDHYHNRFVHSILTQLSHVTKNVKLGPGVTNPYLIHPAVTAAAMATLDELSGGRSVLGISAGDPTYLKSVEMEQDEPIKAVDEAVTIIRRLLAGEELEFSGEKFTCDGARLKFPAPNRIPIYIGGRKEQMMRLAGRKADGVLFNAAHPADIEECIKFVKKGASDANRNLKDFQKVAYVATSVGKNREKARKRARTLTSFMAASAPRSTIEREEISKKKIEKIQEELMKGNMREAEQRVSEKMIDTFSVSGGIEKLENRIRDLKDIGVEQIVIGSPIGPQEKPALEKIDGLVEQYS